METNDRKAHWENIYETRPLHEVSWFQPTPHTSLELIRQYQVGLHDRIIDVGGGDSLLVDHLLNAGFTDITVLDISTKAIERAKVRLGDQAGLVKWVVSDIVEFKPDAPYDCWHDRATFHFLTQEAEITAYLEVAEQSLKANGLMIMGTFSEQGPEMCSGIRIRQYSEQTMTEKLHHYFEKIRCFTIDHKTPSNSIQSFVFCCFRKMAA
jgi:2-polyprenyl-3-methyl-5-hydroxy-6-metoxy-1,4-benzoquinol methylase